MASTSGSSGGSTNPTFRRVMRYLFDPVRENTDHENNIVVLGHTYDPKWVAPLCNDEADDPESKVETEQQYSTKWPEPFLEDVESRIWMTYRTGFDTIPKAENGPSSVSLGGFLRGGKIDLRNGGFQSDSGWGCMIRTGQSLLANALMLLELGREWRYDKDQVDEREISIVKQFADEPSAPFSLHRFVAHGKEYCGKMPGEWFGPSAAASSIKALCEETGSLRVYISDGSDVYENQLMREAYNKGDEFKPLLILLGMRLGIDKVNQVYWDSLKRLLCMPHSVGIAGGRPSSSHYFFGYQNNELFYLDPHISRPMLKAEELPEELESVHTTRIRLLGLEEVDPSMLVGFLIRSEQEYYDWKDGIIDSTSRSVINISQRAPVINCRSSISVGSDQEGEFIDVGLGGSDGSEDEGEATDTLKESVVVESDGEQVLLRSDLDVSTDQSVIESSATQTHGYDIPVVIDTSEMLSGSNNSSYVEPSSLDMDSFGPHDCDPEDGDDEVDDEVDDEGDDEGDEDGWNKLK